ncbi:MAG: hypothetical protein GXN93_02290 [Candidatus Diapherotrites archaeon]|nr:hypothetical protein [Candidatus Diapherotrites archaeon]
MSTEESEAELRNITILLIVGGILIAVCGHVWKDSSLPFNTLSNIYIGLGVGILATVIARNYYQSSQKEHYENKDMRINDTLIFLLGKELGELSKSIDSLEKEVAALRKTMEATTNADQNQKG